MVQRTIGRCWRPALAARLFALAAIVAEEGARAHVVHAGVRAPEVEPTHAELEALYTRGEERFVAGDLDGSIAAFAEGLAQLVPEGDARLRAYFAVSLAIAHLDRFERSSDRADLDRAHELLAATVEEDAAALRGEPRLEALARRNLERAREHLDRLRDPASDRPDPSPEPADAAAVDPSPPGATPANDPIESEAIARRRAAGIGLLVSGTALLAGGIAIVVDGATLERRARAIAEDPPMGRQAQYIDEEVPRLQRIRYGIAGPVLAAGVGLIVGGAILLHRARPDRRLVWSPAIGPRGVTISLAGSF